MIILWDLHEVVFHRTNGDWITTFFAFKHKKAVIKKLCFKTTRLLFYFVLSKCKLTKKEITSEELLTQAYASKNDALIDLVYKFSAHYKPDYSVAKLIQSLNQKGYTQHIGSNIGPTLLATFQRDFPEIMNCFSYAHIVTCPDVNKKHQTIKKPDPAFFYTYLEKQNIDPAQIIFIDDKETNVKAAQSCGIQGIVFKNSTELQDALALKM